MILGTTVKMLARQVPNYHLVSQAIARGSLSICACRNCKYAEWRDFKKRKREGDYHVVCKRVVDRVDDFGIAIVSENGTCDKAEFIKIPEEKELTLK